MEYTWDIKINNIVPYNIESQQRDIIENISWTITGTKGGKSITQGGCIDFDVAQGVSTETFAEITTINKATLQSWIEARVGTARINEMKAEIETTIDSLPDNWEPVPGA